MTAIINPQSLTVPKMEVPLTDGDKKTPNRSWWLFFNNLCNRVGGAVYNLVPNTPTVVTTTTYTVSQYDTTLVFNTTAACQVTLPTPTNVVNSPSAGNQSQLNGVILYLTNTAAFAITSATSNVIPLGSNTAGTAILSTSAKFAMLQFDGTHWRTIMSN